jgi:hypothetical protein
MAKIVPSNVVLGEEAEEIPASNLDIDYEVKIEMIALDSEWELDEDPQADPNYDVIPRMHLNIEAVAPDGSREWIITDVYHIQHSRLAKYIPSRVYFDIQRDNFVLLYYTSPLIKIAPFAQDGEVYCFALKLDPTRKYVYDVRARVFIDQIATPDGMYCFFIFGNDSYDYLISPKM